MAVEAHAAFFDRLVALVPPKYYLHTDTDRVNLRYEKKAVRVEAKAAFKAQYKAAKLAKMDPDQAPTTLDLQRQLQAGAQDRASGAVPSTPVPDKEPTKQPRSPTAAPEAGRASGATLTFADGQPPSREELRERLQKKLELMRQQRKAEAQASSGEKAKAWREQALSDARQRSKAVKRAADGASKPAPRQPEARQNGKPQKVDDAGQALTRLEGGEGKSRKARKPSKAQLLAQAEGRAAAGVERTQEEAWSAAAARASGEKVFDDAKLLRKSLKKEGKLKAKKQKAWQDRQSKQDEEQKRRQQKRKDNISTRIQKKKDRKKDRRDKKLLRAGFEGRKAGFITPAKKA